LRIAVVDAAHMLKALRRCPAACCLLGQKIAQRIASWTWNGGT